MQLDNLKQLPAVGTKNKVMKKLHEIFIIIFCLLLSNNFVSKGQSLPTDDYCRPTSEKASFGVNFFLTSSSFEEERIESGTTNIDVQEIRPVSEVLNCQKLYDIVQGKLLSRN